MIEVSQVQPDDDRLDRLLQLYIHEWSALVATPIGADARYRYPGLASYADRDRRAAYLFIDDDLPIGFALVAADEQGQWHVKEFFVIAGVRRAGTGTEAAHRMFATRSRPWTWTVREENAGALDFWRRVAPDAACMVELGADGITRTRFRLPSPGGDQPRAEPPVGD